MCPFNGLSIRCSCALKKLKPSALKEKKLITFFDTFDTGPGHVCSSEQRRFRFNKKTGKCEDFSTLNCDNGYSSIDECEARCVSQQQQRRQERINGKQEKCNDPPGEH